MASKEKQTIVVDHVHSKREGPEVLAVLIAVVFVRKHLT